jgi:hypothetical protein
VTLVAAVSGAEATFSPFSVREVDRGGGAPETLFSISPPPDSFTIANPEHMVTVTADGNASTLSLVSLVDGTASPLGQLPDTLLAVTAGAGLVAAATCSESPSLDCDPSDSQLWLLQPGTRPRRIATVPFQAGLTWGSLVPSPDGRTLAVSTFNSCGDRAECKGYELRLVQIADGSVHRIGFHGRWQSFSPDGRYLAYIGALRGDPEPNVMMYDTRRGTVRRLGPGWVAAWAPRTPDRLAFGGRTLRLFDGRTTQVIANEASADIWGGECCDYALAWSPDGRALAFSYVPAHPGNNWLPRLAILTLKPRKLYTVAAKRIVDDPKWSPDSTELVYVASTSSDAGHSSSFPFGDDTQLFTVSATGHPRQITSQPHSGLFLEELTWSATGTAILYSTR